MTGGYKIVDFHNTNLVTGAETPVTISGVYSEIENNYRKAILISGLVIDGVEKASSFVECVQGDNSCTLSVYGKTITVSSLDVVSIA